MAAIVFWVVVIGAILSFFTKQKGIQIKPSRGNQSEWLCKDCNEKFNSLSRDAKCPKCGSTNVWPSSTARARYGFTSTIE